MILYYFLLSAVFAWSAITFMSAAAHTTRPALVASTGWILVALVTLSGSLTRTAGQLPLMLILICSLALLAVVVTAMARGGFLTLAESAVQSSEPAKPGPAASNPVPSPEDRVDLMADKSSLTNRERDVLRALVLTEDKNQQIANELGISRRQLQTHISCIYQKTGARTRAGLVMRANGRSQSACDTRAGCPKTRDNGRDAYGGTRMDATARSRRSYRPSESA